ncbi:MAG: glycerophosphodiester phosphodiesterase family protein [Cyanobacteria bacterium P01_A01_bin.114]
MLRRCKTKKWVLAVLTFAALVYLNNASFLAAPIGPGPVLVAHRALSQDFEREGLNNETCTASRMIPVAHEYLENTIPAMDAAFAYGADVVEFDVHRTTDKRFAVFHDWTLDCRTEGTGVTREHSLDDLQKLDVGYGYTADGGKSWPFRGKGVGMTPSLDAVLTTFPERDFLIDVKSNDAEEGALLADRLTALSAEHKGQLMVHGGTQPVGLIRERLPQIQTITRPRLKRCLTRYFLLGWSGRVPSSCDRSLLMVPVNIAPWLWGWPNRFLQRMKAVNTQVLLIGDYNGESFSQGFDDPERLKELPSDYSGGIWTNRVDLIGPAVERLR